MSDNPQHLAKLRWRCRRGMGELDSLLLRFLDRGYADLDEQQRAVLDDLLDQEDDRLWAWFLGRAPASTPELQGMISHILQFSAP